MDARSNDYGGDIEGRRGKRICREKEEKKTLLAALIGSASPAKEEDGSTPKEKEGSA